MILKDGDTFTPTDEQVLKWQQAYKNIDVFTELDAMSCWCDANPSKRKTKRGIERFINSWLNRANQTGGSPAHMRTEAGDKPTLRQWTTTDFLTHDFMDCARFRQKMLEEHGQYMSVNGERVHAKR